MSKDKWKIHAKSGAGKKFVPGNVKKNPDSESNGESGQTGVKTMDPSVDNDERTSKSSTHNHTDESTVNPKKKNSKDYTDNSTVNSIVENSENKTGNNTVYTDEDTDDSTEKIDQLVKEIVETHTKKKKKGFYETRTQVNVWLENELAREVDRLAKGKGRGAKTKIFNQAIRLYLQVLEQNKSSN